MYLIPFPEGERKPLSEIDMQHSYLRFYALTTHVYILKQCTILFLYLNFK